MDWGGGGMNGGTGKVNGNVAAAEIPFRIRIWTIRQRKRIKSSRSANVKSPHDHRT
jgi:hypothetical protein